MMRSGETTQVSLRKDCCCRTRDRLFRSFDFYRSRRVTSRRDHVLFLEAAHLRARAGVGRLPGRRPADPTGGRRGIQRKRGEKGLPRVSS